MSPALEEGADGRGVDVGQAGGHAGNRIEDAVRASDPEVRVMYLEPDLHRPSPAVHRPGEL
jgi:hypothetical protein